MAKKKKEVAPTLFFAKETVYVPKTPVTLETKQAMVAAIEKHWAQEAEHYGYTDPKPESVVRKQQQILDAVDLEKANEATERAKHCVQTMILGAWARGAIDGPLSERSLERKIKQRENLCGMLEGKALENQLLRIKELKQQLNELRKQGKNNNVLPEEQV